MDTVSSVGFLVHGSSNIQQDHIIGSPLALSSETYAAKAWVKFSDVAALQRPDVQVIQGKASQVDCEKKNAVIVTASDLTLTLSYDYLVVATGVRRAWPVVPQSLRRKQYLFEAGDHITAVSKASRGVVVVGGGMPFNSDICRTNSTPGAVGIEMAAELKLVQPHINVTLAHSHSKLLSSEPLPEEVKDCALDLAKDAGLNILLNHRLEKTVKKSGEDGSKFLELTYANGNTMVASEVIMAVSRSVPSTDFLPNAALDSDGYVKILPT